MATVDLCGADDIRPGERRRFTAEGENIVLCSVDGTVAAFRNRCPHQRIELLHEGSFTGGVITCPMHGWEFDVRTGESRNASGRLTLFPAEVRNGRVVVTIPEPW